ncbi:hypothetical protein B0H67DRAFT_550577 [Lasiosphaeris hirsuta]|uniref:Cytochrome P450 n=1 Tax=Lasiosphaeris hirsuta TaxID=260670 RepID=A0AA40E740_9PEZI|nr:hypothetical protein B0H67DRAFT_550577 [Lasiosphaeris hirsuta]
MDDSQAQDEPLEKDSLWVRALHRIKNAYPITYAPRDDHVRQSRAFSYPFSNSPCVQKEPLIQTQVEKFTSRLEEFAEKQEPLNIRDWYTFATLDIISVFIAAGSDATATALTTLTYLILIHQPIYDAR